MKRFGTFMNWKENNSFKMPILSKLVYKFHTIPVRIQENSTRLFAKNWQANSKVYMRILCGNAKNIESPKPYWRKKHEEPILLGSWLKTYLNEILYLIVINFSLCLTSYTEINSRCMGPTINLFRRVHRENLCNLGVDKDFLDRTHKHTHTHTTIKE